MASGDTLVVFTATAAQPPDADFATFDTILTASADEPDHSMLVLDFDPGTTEEYAYFTGVMPRNYGGGGLTLNIGWSSDATTGVCRWAVAFKSITDDADDLDSKVFAAPNTVDATTASAGGEVDYAVITFTDGADMDSIAAGEMFVLELSRNSSHANDTLNSNDAELHFIEIQET
jgi:hypothetical protein